MIAASPVFGAIEWTDKAPLTDGKNTILVSEQESISKLNEKVVEFHNQGKDAESIRFTGCELDLNLSEIVSESTSYLDFWGDCTVKFGGLTFITKQPQVIIGYADWIEQEGEWVPVSAPCNFNVLCDASAITSPHLVEKTEKGTYTYWNVMEAALFDFVDGQITFSFGGASHGQKESVTGYTNIGFLEDVYDEEYNLVASAVDSLEDGQVAMVIRQLSTDLNEDAWNGMALSIVAFNAKSVPEPATGTLSLLALAGLCARRRRK